MLITASITRDDNVRVFKVVMVGSFPWLQISALGWEETARIALGLCS